MNKKSVNLLLILIVISCTAQFISVPIYACPVVTIISPEDGETYYTTEIPLEYKVDKPTDWEGYSLDGDDYVTLDGNTTLSGLSLGYHTLTVSANETGPYWGHSTVHFTVADSTSPVVTIISPEEKMYYTSFVPLTYRVEEEYPDWVGYSLNGAANVTLTGNTTLTNLGLGSHDLSVYASDTSGNWGKDTVSFTVEDSTSPVVTIISPEEKTYYSSSIPLTYRVEEEYPEWVGYSLDGAAYETLTGNTTLSGLSLGSHDLTVYANDTSGNWDSDTVYFTVEDSTSPVVTIISPMNTTYTTASIPLEYKVEEEYPDWVGYSLDGAANVTLTGNTTLSGLSLGIHDITVYASDTSGNWGKDMVYFTVKDATPPVVDIVSPMNTTYTAASVPLNYVVDEENPEWVGYSLDGAANETLTGNTTLTNLGLGPHDLTVYASDTSSNWGKDTIYFTVAKDETPPAVTIKSPVWEKTYYSSSVPLTYRVEEENLDWVGYSLDGAANVTLTGNTTLTNLGLGDHDLAVYASDTSGNWGKDTVGFAVEDVTPPVVTIVSPMNTTYTTTSIPLEYKVEEEYPDWVGYSLDGTTNKTLIGNTTLSGLSLGSHDLTVYASDTSGHWDKDTVYFTVKDATPPVVTIISPKSITYETETSSTSIPLTYKVNEPADWVGYSLDDAANKTLTGNTTLTNLELGSHTLTVHANDTSGNMGHSSVSFKVDKEKPPPPPINWPPEPVTLHDPTDITNTSMSLTWTKNEDYDFKKYVLYYSTSKGSTGQKVTEITDRSGTSYQMTGLSQNTTYYYVVRVYDTGNLYSDSNKVSARTETTIIPLDEEPPILTILSPVNMTYDTSSVELTWLANEPLKWAGFSLNGGANTTVTGNQTISGLEDGLYDLILYGTDLAGNNGSDSVSFTIHTVVPVVPDTTPPEITHNPVTEGVEGNPIEVSAVVTDESGVSEVELYYRKGGDTDYSSVEMVTLVADTYAATIPASFVDAETIEYYIFASDGVNEATHPSVAPTSSPHVVDINLIPEPVALYRPATGAISTNSVELTWSESEETDFRNYVIHMSGSEGVLGDDIEEINERSETSYTVEELESGTTYYFTVRVYDTGGLYADSAQLEVGTAVRRVFWSTYMFTFLLILLPLAAGGAIYYMRKRGKRPAGITTPGDELI
jgi:hypothetical protein